MAQLCRSRWVAVRVFFLLSLWTSSAAPQQRPREAVLSPGSVQPRQRLRRENTGLRGRRLISQEDDAAEAGEAGATVHHSPVRPLADERLDQPMPSPPLSPQSPLFEHNWHVPTRTNNALVDGPAGQSHQRRLDELAALSARRLSARRECQMAAAGNRGRRGQTPAQKRASSALLHLRSHNNFDPILRSSDGTSYESCQESQERARGLD